MTILVYRRYTDWLFRYYWEVMNESGNRYDYSFAVTKWGAYYAAKRAVRRSHRKSKEKRLLIKEDI